MQRQEGFTLIEVLISIVIIAIGMIGLAALQLTVVRESQGTYTRTQAANMAVFITDRMRANDDAIREKEDGVYVCGDPSKVANCAYNIDIDRTYLDPGCGSDCDYKQMAALDAYNWKAMLGQGLNAGESGIMLPNVKASVTPLANDPLGRADTPPAFSIVIKWDASRSRQDEATYETYELTVVP